MESHGYDMHYYTVEAFAAQVCEAERTIREKIKAGEIEAYKPSKRWLIPLHALPEYVEGENDEDEEEDELDLAPVRDFLGDFPGYPNADQIIEDIESGELELNLYTNENDELCLDCDEVDEWLADEDDDWDEDDEDDE